METQHPEPLPDVPRGEDVTTEPQRRALEEMSQALTDKLHAMVAEQEQRIRDFAAQHQSQSPLPWMPEETAPQEIPAPAPLPQQAVPSRQAGLIGRTSPSITNGPRLDTGAASRREPVRTSPPQPVPRQPVPPKKEKESTIGAGMMGFFIFLLAIFLLRTCN